MYGENTNDHPTDDAGEDQVIKEADNKKEPAKKKRVRKPSMRARIKQVSTKMNRISIIAGEALDILKELDDGIALVEDLKKKLKEM